MASGRRRRFVSFVRLSLCIGANSQLISLFSPLIMKVRSRASSIKSGTSTPGGGAFQALSEGDLKRADDALSKVNGTSS